jgi:hypothetical protein
MNPKRSARRRSTPGADRRRLAAGIGDYTRKIDAPAAKKMTAE